MKKTRKIIYIDDELCDGCGQCVPSCAEGAITIVDGKATLIADKYCDGLGACIGECPTGALTIIEREAEAFDEEAVEELLKSQEAKKRKQQEGPLLGGCPSARLQSFVAPPSSRTINKSEGTVTDSALSHWPVQIRLVPPKAPFLQDADLLITADCTPVAYPHFHRDFLKGKVVLLGCPKFDDAQEYVQKFSAIFQESDIRSITVLVMEVPCCQGLPAMVEKGMKLANKKIPLEKVIISARGQIMGKEAIAA